MKEYETTKIEVELPTVWIKFIDSFLKADGCPWRDRSHVIEDCVHYWMELVQGRVAEIARRMAVEWGHLQDEKNKN